MAYLVLIGAGGWTQRWEISSGHESEIAETLTRIGLDETSTLPLMDPNTGTDVRFVVAWAEVAAGYILPSPEEFDAPGPYA